MVVNVNLVMQVTALLQSYPKNLGADKSDQTVLVWITVELMAFFAIIASSIAFLFTRSLTKLELILDDIPEKMQLPEIDTIVATTKTYEAFSQFYCQCAVSIGIFWFLRNFEK